MSRQWASYTGEEQHIIARAADLFNVAPDRILSSSRHQRAVSARFAVATVLREQGLTLEEIGGVLDQDHTTIIYALKAADGWRKTQPLFAQRLSNLLSAGKEASAENDRA